MTSYIDTHIHLNLLGEVGLLLGEARQAGVGRWVVPGVSAEDWPALQAVAEAHEGVYLAPGVHPCACGGLQARHYDVLRSLLQHPRAVAIGEVGLDRQVVSSWLEQEALFTRQIHLARELDKPLLIHARRSTGRVLELLRREEASQVGGIFHAFSGSLESALRIIDLGFLLGVGGVVTFAEAKRLAEVVRLVPEQVLVLETDAPDMTPIPYQGEPNRPAYLPLIAERVAVLRGMSVQEVARLTTANACRVLRLPPP